jgi:hypothetical protein
MNKQRTFNHSGNKQRTFNHSGNIQEVEAEGAVATPELHRCKWDDGAHSVNIQYALSDHSVNIQ